MLIHLVNGPLQTEALLPKPQACHVAASAL